MTDCLCEDCSSHFDQLKILLTAAGLEFKLNSRLVRGLDYYTKTAFEIQYAPLGAQSAVCGGGRYDGLIAECGGQPTPGIGFAIGLERVLLALEKQELLPDAVQTLDVFVLYMGDQAQAAAFTLLRDLRHAGFTADMDFMGRSLKAQMKLANKYSARFAVIIGYDEVQTGSVNLKDMATGEQQQISMDDLLNKLDTEVKD